MKMPSQIPQQGWSQWTPAMRASVSSAVAGISRGVRRSSKRRKSSKAAAGGKRKKRAGSSRKRSTASRLVKGSKAAKAYMAKIRKLRK